MKPHHSEARRLNPMTRACRAAGVEPALGLAADLLPLNRGVLLVIGGQPPVASSGSSGPASRSTARGSAGREPAGTFRAGLELIGQPVAIDRHGIKVIWAEEDPRWRGRR